MSRTETGRVRISLDVQPEEHRQLKVLAALHGRTMREYILGCLRERLHHEQELKEVAILSTHLDADPVLKDLWDNKRDAAYDHL